MRTGFTDADFRYDLRIGLQPALLPACAFAIGIAASTHAPITPAGWLVVAVGFTALGRIAHARWRRPYVAVALALCAVSCAGAWRSRDARDAVPLRPLVRLVDVGALAPGDTVTLTGFVDAPPQELLGRRRCTLAVTSVATPGSHTHPLRGRVQVSLAAGGAADDVRYGTVLEVTGVVDDDLAYRNPGVETLRESLRRRGIDASIHARPDAVRVVDQTTPCPVLAVLFGIRTRWLNWIDAHFSDATAGVVRALLLGDSSRLEHGTAEAYRASGTFHVLVISGAHIAIVAACLLWPVSRLSRHRWVRLVAGAVPVWLYSLMVGLPAPVWRAALTVTIALVARAAYRCAPPANTLAVAAIAVLACDPAQLDDPGFQLTFAAVAAIVLVAAPALEKIRRVGMRTPTRSAPYPPRVPRAVRAFAGWLYQPRNAGGIAAASGSVRIPTARGRVTRLLVLTRAQRPVRYVLAAVWVATVVQLALGPLSVAHFHRITPTGAFATCVVELVLGFALVAGLGMLLASSVFPPVAAAVAPAVGWLVDLATSAARASPAGTFVAAPAGAARIAGPAAVVALAFLAIALSRWQPIPRSLSELARRPSRLSLCGVALAVPLALSAMPIAALSGERAADGKLHVIFLDVGQGDATLVRFPDGRTMLVDAGGRPRFDDGPRGAPAVERFDIGERIVCQTLWTLGIDRLDLVVASHGDADHVGGFDAVMTRFPVGAAVISAGQDEHLDSFRTMARRALAPIVELSAGDRFAVGGATVEAVGPADSGQRGNDGSLVLRISFGRRSFLLTGDVERTGELAIELAARHTGRNLAVDVLKAAHHGSRTSSSVEFVRATAPSWIVISAPRVSPYGHPHAEALARLAGSGAAIVQTGRGGAVEFVTDGATLDVHGLSDDATFDGAVTTIGRPTLRVTRSRRDREILQ